MRGGKSELIRIAVEAALDAGKVVLVCNADCYMKKRRVRRKGLVLDVIETLPR